MLMKQANGEREDKRKENRKKDEGKRMREDGRK